MIRYLLPQNQNRTQKWDELKLSFSILRLDECIFALGYAQYFHSKVKKFGAHFFRQKKSKKWARFFIIQKKVKKMGQSWKLFSFQPIFFTFFWIKKIANVTLFSSAYFIIHKNSKVTSQEILHKLTSGLKIRARVQFIYKSFTSYSFDIYRLSFTMEYGEAYLK